MPSLLRTALTACLTCACLPAAEPVQLFNGRDLTGWYTYLKSTGREDPKRVFTVQDGLLSISGEEWGGIATLAPYSDYRLVVEWRWSGATWGERKEKARDSGILIHCTGEDGAAGGYWLESIESQIIEGGSGDIILVGGKSRPTVTAEVREDSGELYWSMGGKPMTVDRGRINWYGRDPRWTDTINYRGPLDVEAPVGGWNRHEITASGGDVITLLNGVIVNWVTNSSHRAGKIQIQSEGAGILIRKVELQPLK